MSLTLLLTVKPRLACVQPECGVIMHSMCITISYLQYCVLFEENKAIRMLIKSKQSDGYSKAERCRGG